MPGSACSLQRAQRLYFNSTVSCDAVEAAVKSGKSPPMVWFALPLTSTIRALFHRDIGSGTHCDSDIGLRQGRSVIDAVARHPNDRFALRCPNPTIFTIP
jgi:hypothetical protein